MAVITINQSNFKQQVEQSDQTVLLDFWAPWCGYCHMLAPVLEELEADWQAAGRQLVIGKINTDEEPELAEAFEIDGLPTLIVFKQGKLYQRASGFRPKAAVEALLD